MSENIKYIWRCAKCSAHFANICQIKGNIKQEKKCPKCKSLNTLSLSDKEIGINCFICEPAEEESKDNHDW
jgi:phage FluMu protein Com